MALKKLVATDQSFRTFPLSIWEDLAEQSSYEYGECLVLKNFTLREYNGQKFGSSSDISANHTTHVDANFLALQQWWELRGKFHTRYIPLFQDETEITEEDLFEEIEEAEPQTA